MMILKIFCAVIVILITFVIYKYIEALNYWKKRKIPYETPLPLIGNYLRIFFDNRGLISMFDINKKFENERFYGIHRAQNPELVVKDLDLIKNILIKDFDHFSIRSPGMVMDSQPLTQHLFNLHGHLWKMTRKKLHVIFTTSKLKAMLPLIIEKSGTNRKCLATRNYDLPDGVDIYDFFSNFFIDVIGCCCFGIEPNAMTDKDSRFKHFCLETMKITPYKTFVFMLENSFPRVISFLHIRMLSVKIEKFFCSVMEESIRIRENTKVKKNDLIDILLEIKNKDKEEIDGFTIDSDFMTAQAFMIFVAGFETSSTVSSFTLHELAYNPEVLKKVHEEIDRTLNENNGELTFEAISNMTYMNMVLDETMRMHPPVSFIQRSCTIPYKVPETDYVIEKGTTITIPAHVIHNDPKHFNEPEKFIPERFSSENKKNIPQMAVLSFGEGPRHCIGTRLARMQTIVGLVSLLREHTVEPCNKSKRKLELNFGPVVAWNRNGIWLKIKRRQISTQL